MKTTPLVMFAGFCLGIAITTTVFGAIKFATAKPAAESSKKSNPPENSRYTMERIGSTPHGSAITFLTDNTTGERWIIASGWHGEPAIASANMKKETK
jgi:hypothetical protein